LNVIVTLKCGLKVTKGHWNWCHSKAWVRFPIQCQRMAWFWKPGYGSFKNNENENCNYGRICTRLWGI